MDSLIKICKKNKLKIIEDCSQAHLAEFNKKKLEILEILLVLVYPTKNLSAIGDAGAIITIQQRIIKLQINTRIWLEKENYSIRDGSNKRLDEIHRYPKYKN